MMSRAKVITLLAVFFGPVFIGAQEPLLTWKVLPSMPEAEVQAIQLSRANAQKEIFKDHDQFAWPDLAGALLDPNNLIAVARVTAISRQQKGANLSVSLEIEQFLRGSSEKKEIETESLWRPVREGVYIIFNSQRPTALDRKKPELGGHYIIGYNLHTYGDFGNHAYVPGAIDLSVPGQGELLAQVQHFLAIDAATGNSNLDPFIAALNEPIPWIRDVAAHRLTDYGKCSASPTCRQALVVRTSELLQSKNATERYEALLWMEPIIFRAASDGGSADDSAIRQLLASAMADPNVEIGDQAYSLLEQWKFQRSAQAGHCLEIISQLRRSAVWDYSEVEGHSIRSPIGMTTTCIPPTPAAQN